MKSLIAAVLGLALTISLAPAAQAQSLNFGSLGGREADQSPDPKPWTEGVGYEITAFVHEDSRTDETCDINASLDLMSATGIPHGRLAWQDHTTGFEYEDEYSSPIRRSALLLPYPNRYRYTEPDFSGTTRDITFFIIENGTNARLRLGTLNLSFPATCPISGKGNSLTLETGMIRP